jgi:hypothetical protein
MRRVRKPKKVATPEKVVSPDELLLDGYLPLTEAAKQPHMPSLRSLQRQAAMRCLDGLIYLGRRPFLHVPTFRAGLAARVMKTKRGSSHA